MDTKGMIWEWAETKRSPTILISERTQVSQRLISFFFTFKTHDRANDKKNAIIFFFATLKEKVGLSLPLVGYRT